MPFYTGSTADGSDMQEVHGAYINPNNPDEWSSEPYPSQKAEMRNMDEVKKYANARYSFRDVYLQIQNKNCKLNRRLRDWVCSFYDEDGNFIVEEK